MPEETKDELLKDIAVGIKAVQDKVDEQGTKLDAIDQDSIKKTSDDVADALEKLQTMASQKAVD